MSHKVGGRVLGGSNLKLIPGKILRKAKYFPVGFSCYSNNQTFQTASLNIFEKLSKYQELEEPLAWPTVKPQQRYILVHFCGPGTFQPGVPLSRLHLAPILILTFKRIVFMLKYLGKDWRTCRTNRPVSTTLSICPDKDIIKRRDQSWARATGEQE